jgi:hypothetical protein
MLIVVPSAALAFVDDHPCFTVMWDEAVTDEEDIRETTNDAIFRIYCPSQLGGGKPCRQNPGI